MKSALDPTSPRIEGAVLQLYGTAHNLSFADIEIVTGLSHRDITGILRRNYFPVRHNAVSDLVKTRGAFKQLLRW